MRAVTTLVLCATFLLAGCNNDARRSNRSNPRPPSEVTGVVVDVESAGLGAVRSFELKKGADTYQIFIDPAVDYGFDVGHLTEHLASGDPVRVEIDQRGDRLFARSIDDA